MAPVGGCRVRHPKYLRDTTDLRYHAHPEPAVSDTYTPGGGVYALRTTTGGALAFYYLHAGYRVSASAAHQFRVSHEPARLATSPSTTTTSSRCTTRLRELALATPQPGRPTRSGEGLAVLAAVATTRPVPLLGELLAPSRRVAGNRWASDASPAADTQPRRPQPGGPGRQGEDDLPSSSYPAKRLHPGDGDGACPESF